MQKNKQQRTLGSIADIRTGFTFREKIQEVAAGTGNAHVVQIKDARKIWDESNSTQLPPSLLPEIIWEGKDKAYVTSDNVIIPSRGGYFRAFCLASAARSNLPVVVSSQFLILTPCAAVTPEFLCWSLNQPTVQYYLTEGAGSQGTSITMLSAKMAHEIKLDIPTLAIQNKILELANLWKQEQQITQALLANREAMLQGMFQKLLNEKN